MMPPRLLQALWRERSLSPVRISRARGQAQAPAHPGMVDRARLLEFRGTAEMDA